MYNVRSLLPCGEAEGICHFITFIRSNRKITFLSCDLTFTFELDLEMNQYAKYIGQRSFCLKDIVRTHILVHTPMIDCSTWTTKVVGIRIKQVLYYAQSLSAFVCRRLAVRQIGHRCRRPAAGSCPRPLRRQRLPARRRTRIGPDSPIRQKTGRPRTCRRRIGVFGR